MRTTGQLLWILTLLCAPVAHAASQFTLHSGKTSITVRASAGAPTVERLCWQGRQCWADGGPEPLLQTAERAGQLVSLRWRWNAAESMSGERLVRLVYDCSAPRLQIAWEWQVRGEGGPIEHTVRILNKSRENLWIPFVDSLRLSWKITESEQLEELWVEKGAGGPTAIGTHRSAVPRGYKWTGVSSTYAHPPAGAQREMIPYVLIQRRNDGESGWYAGIEFSGRTRIRVHRTAHRLETIVGLNAEPGPSLTHLAPGGTFETPTVFLGAFEGGPDAAGNTLRRWVRTVLSNPITVADAQYPLVVNNSWGSGMAIDAEQARSLIRGSAELGFEMFHLDAGWFRGVGDWQPDPVKFPGGLAPIADYAHARGLRFGLWMDWALAGRGSRPGALSAGDVRIRDWLTTDAKPDWAPAEAFKGITMDIGDPPVQEWAKAELTRVVDEYHLDMLEHDGYVVAQGCDRADHPHAPIDSRNVRRYEDSGFWWVDSTNSTDVSYYATRAYYDLYSSLRQRHPQLLLEICNDGGRMVDFGSAAHGDYFSISDAYDPLSNRRAFYDSSYVLPPAMLEAYVQKWPAPSLEAFRYGLRSGMMGWFTLMLDTTAWTPEQRASAKEAIALYKARLRPMIRTADLYHVSARPDGVHWDGMEYIDRTRGSGVVFVFRGTAPREVTHRFVLRGLQSDREYRLTFVDGSAPNRVMSGRTLMQKGLAVELPQTESSELVFFEPTAP